MLQQDQDVQEDQAVPDDEMETVYLTVYDEDPEPPRFWQRGHYPKLDRSRVVSLCMQALAIGLLTGFCFLSGAPTYTIHTLTVPAIVLPSRTVSVQVALTPTGHTSYPATEAHGILTIFNGSIFTQALPQGFVLTGTNGMEVETDHAVTIPPGNPPDYGIATVQAHTLRAGKSANLAAGQIDAVYGSSIYLKNLTAFTGGHDASSTTSVTAQDRAAALATARARLATKRPAGLLAAPCAEAVQQDERAVTVRWTCQPVIYRAPLHVQVLAARLVGREVILRVKTVVWLA